MNLRKRVLIDLGVDLPISGGNSSSKEDPIIIHRVAPNDFVSVENAFVAALCARRRVEWKVKGQCTLKLDDKTLDMLTIETVQTTPTEIVRQTENYYFDITECV